MKRDKLLSLLEEHAEFSASEKSLIFEALEIIVVNKGEFLLKYDEICQQVHFVLEGVVRCFILNEKGEELTTTFISEGEMTTRIESFFTQTPSSGYLQCETDCELISISKEKWDFLCRNTKNFGNAIGQFATICMAQKLEIQRRLLMLEAKDAYLDFIKFHEKIIDRVPMNHISSYLGITPSSLSRIKKEITEH